MHIAQLKIHVLDFVKTRVRFGGCNSNRVDINGDDTLRAKAARGESEDAAPVPRSTTN
jgi:hypothetical protein